MGLSLIAAFACFSGVVAFRSSQRESSHIQQGSDEVSSHPANGNCVIGSGHSVSRGCNHGMATETVYDCDDDNAINSCCISETKGDLGGSSGYNRFTKTKDEWDKLTKVVVDAEFAGYGASVSVGVDYLKSSKSSESSIGFFCGSSKKVSSRQVNYPKNLKIDDSAAWLLGWSPSMFFQSYGTDYVHKIVYGGSFLGSFTLSSRSEKTKDSLKVFADIAVEQPAFNADLAASFNTAKTQVKSNITLYASAKWSGGTGLKQNYSDPASMGNMFDYWSKSVDVAPAPLVLYTRKWTSAKNFYNIIMNIENNDTRNEAMKLALQEKPTLEFTSQLGQESAKLSFVSGTIDRAITFADESGDEQKQQCLRRVRKNVVRAIIRIQQLDDMTAKEGEKNYHDNDSSELFQSGLLTDDVKKC
jgi:hypothetical protein